LPTETINSCEGVHDLDYTHGTRSEKRPLQSSPQKLEIVTRKTLKELLVGITDAFGQNVETLG
jgi:hypothetical protein